MNRIWETARVPWLAVICTSAVVLIAGCATTASYRPEIDSMKAALAEAKAAGAETLAPEEYARAEACLDSLTHEATEFKPFADPNASKYTGKCRVSLQALKDKMAAARVAAVPSPTAPPVAAPAEAPAPEADQGVYPGTGTLGGAIAALPPAEAPQVPAVEAPPPSEVPPAPEAPKPVVPATPPPAVTPPAPVAAAEPERKKEPTLEDIFFDYDQALIRPDAQKTLDENTQWLRGNTKSTIIIEGHCDERGTPEYNLGLGQRRAQATRDYLVTGGVDDKRIKIISYGRERPFVVGHDESAWKWNRRAHFVLQ